jgi:hypothetical protein
MCNRKASKTQCASLCAALYSPLNTPNNFDTSPQKTFDIRRFFALNKSVQARLLMTR